MADTESKTWYSGRWPASVPLYKKVGGFDYINEESINISYSNLAITTSLSLCSPFLTITLTYPFPFASQPITLLHFDKVLFWRPGRPILGMA